MWTWLKFVPVSNALAKTCVGRHAHDALTFFELVGGKRAELTAGVANVRRVDVAIENVKDFLAALALFLPAREAPERVQIRRAIER